MKTGKAFLDTSRFFITGNRNDINHCMDILSNEDIWWRPNEESNSIGNLLLYVLGSLNEWILSGIAGTEIPRLRQLEFEQRSPLPKDELISKLNSSLHNLDKTIAAIDPSQLTNKIQVVGKEVPGWLLFTS